MVVGEGAPGHQRGDDRHVDPLGQLAQGFGRPGLEDAAPGVDDRPAGFGDEPGRLLDHAGVAVEGRLVAGQRGGHLGVGRPGPVHLGLQDVLRHVEQHRAGAAGGGQVEGLADGEGDLVGIHDELVVLGDRAGDADGVALLEAVGADHRPAHLAGDGHHRHRVHVGVAQRRDQVGGRRPARDHGHPGPAGDVGVALGHVAGALLVADQDVADRRIEDRVVGRQDAAARQAEDHLDLLQLQAPDESLGSGQLHRSPSL